MTLPTTAPSAEPAASRPRRRPRAFDILAWGLLALCCTWTAAGLWHTDVRSLPPIGDQASYYSQAQSLLYDHDNVYSVADQRRATQTYDRNWTAGRFVVHNGDRWLYAKPSTYAFWLAGWMGVLGERAGLAMANGLLLALLGLASLVMLRPRYGWSVAALTTAAFLFFSNVFLYTFVVTADLLITVEVAAFALTAIFATNRSIEPARRMAWAATSFGLLGLLFMEKPPMVLAALPVVALVLFRQQAWRWAVPVLAFAAVALGRMILWRALAPGTGWNPYRGDRWLTANGCLPDAPGALAMKWPTDEQFTLSFVSGRLGHGWGTKVDAAVAFVVGAHTGAVVFMPIAVMVVIALLLRGRRLGWEAWAFLGAFALMALFYVLIYPHNFFGGAYTIGNRYLVQVSPLLIAAVAVGGLPRVRLAWISFASVALGVLMLWPWLLHPRVAFWRTDRRTPVARALSVSDADVSDFRFTLDVDNTRAGVLPRAACAVGEG